PDSQVFQWSAPCSQAGGDHSLSRSSARLMLIPPGLPQALPGAPAHPVPLDPALCGSVHKPSAVHLNR
ncbi:MAG: hypothetical protein OXG88_00280, partial [Gammaproteobacteria bacterium]|nr:hypothetical protein [Gammaproteobacteria bacterium]